MDKWITAFKTFGISIGLSESKAQEMSLNTLIKIQGSLVVTKGMNDLSIFENTLKEIESKYLTIT